MYVAVIPKDQTHHIADNIFNTIREKIQFIAELEVEVMLLLDLELYRQLAGILIKKNEELISTILCNK